MDMHPSIRSFEPLRSPGNDLLGVAPPLRDFVCHSPRGVQSGRNDNRSLRSDGLSSVMDIRLEGVQGVLDDCRDSTDQVRWEERMKRVGDPEATFQITRHLRSCRKAVYAENVQTCLAGQACKVYTKKRGARYAIYRLVNSTISALEPPSHHHHTLVKRSPRRLATSRLSRLHLSPANTPRLSSSIPPP